MTFAEGDTHFESILPKTADIHIMSGQASVMRNWARRYMNGIGCVATNPERGAEMQSLYKKKAEDAKIIFDKFTPDPNGTQKQFFHISLTREEAQIALLLLPDKDTISEEYYLGNGLTSMVFGIQASIDREFADDLRNQFTNVIKRLTPQQEQSTLKNKVAGIFGRK